MLLVREIFTAKPGMASKLAKLFKALMPNEPNTRVMTDVTGEYNTVIMETQVESFAEFGKQMEMYQSGKPDPKVDPKAAEELSNYTEMYLTGRREIFRIW